MNEKTLNYSKQVIEFFENDRTSQELEGPFSAMPELLLLLDKSVKFILPDRGEIIEKYDTNKKDTNLFDNDWADLLHLPFPIVTFEFPFTYRPYELHGKSKSSKRVALCWNPKHDDPDILKLNELLNKIDGNYKENYDGLCVVVFYYIDHLKTWTHSVIGGFIPYSLKSYLVSDDSPNHLLDNEQTGGIVLPIFPNLLNETFKTEMKKDDFNGDNILHKLWKDLYDEIWVILQVCCVLSCDNINIRSITPPEKLQKSRARKGLKPLYTYKALTIRSQGSVYENMYSTGDGSSRRTHFRRGHIRRLENKAVWVRSTVVGVNNFGTVDKEYHIKSNFTHD